MALSPKRSLPLLTGTLGPAGDLPTVDRARKQLGGRASTTSAGRLVALSRANAPSVPGVVLFESPDELHVWLETGLVQRTRPERATALESIPPEALVRAAASATVFAALAEGQRVQYQTPSGQLAEGRLVEKCRYGALVLRDDDTIMAVGFRTLWPFRPASQPS